MIGSDANHKERAVEQFPGLDPFPCESVHSKRSSRTAESPPFSPITSPNSECADDTEELIQIKREEDDSQMRREELPWLPHKRK